MFYCFAGKLDTVKNVCLPRMFVKYE